MPRQNRNDDAALPHNPELERAVLGDIFVDPATIWLAVDTLPPEAFFIERNRMVYEAMCALAREGHQIDFVTVCDQLEQAGQLEEIGGGAYLTVMIEATPTSMHAETHIRRLSELGERRALCLAATRIVRAAHDVDTDMAQVYFDAQSALDEQRLNGTGTPIGDVVPILYDTINGWVENPLVEGEVRGMPTGIPGVDKALGGLEPAFYLLAGRPSLGKTSIALQTASYNAAAGRRVLVWTLEMSKVQILSRLACSHAKVEWDRVRRGVADDGEYAKIVAALGEMADWPLILFDRGMTVANIRAQAKRYMLRGDVDLIIIDSINLMSSATRESNRNYELGAISRNLLLMATELQIPIFGLHHLSRKVEMRSDKRPLLSDLRDSGELEQNADVVLMLYRSGYYAMNESERRRHASFYRSMNCYVDADDIDDILEIIIRKNRLGGPSGRWILTYWNGPHMRVEPLQREREMVL